ncbi:MAG: Holliday junction branch migration protein RuvA [Brevinemataceae bacterium]
MIGAIKGIIHNRTTPKILIETKSGVFYEIHVSDKCFQELPEEGLEIVIYTSTIVREQELYLTGFLSQSEKNLFELLITAKGIGPKQGLKILSECSVSDLRSAIVSGNTTNLTRIKGISSKKAEQLILDLQEKMRKTVTDSPQDKYEDPAYKKKTELLLTMRALGYSDMEIKKPLDTFFEQIETTDKSIELLVTEFLSTLK